MRTVGIRELKARLSAYVQAARAGKPVAVTDRGVVVAELRPPGEVRPETALQRYEDAVAAGTLRPPTDPTDRSWLGTTSGPLAPGEAARFLDAERGES